MLILFSIVVLCLVGFAAWFTLISFREIVAMVRCGQSEPLRDRVKERIAGVMSMVFGHKKVLEERSYGFMHMFYLYGFLILSIGHLELVVFGLTRFLEVFNLHPIAYRYIPFFPKEAIYLYELSQDVMASSVIFVASFALYRRIFEKVPRLLPRSKDAETILWFIVCLYATFFVFVGTETFLRMQRSELGHHWLWHLPISSLIALSIFHIKPIVVQIANEMGYFMHLGVFLAFACYIPRSKHMHLIAAGPNIYFRHLNGVAKPKTIDFEKSETFGADRVQQLSWKSLLDTFACTECGRCDAVCPAHLTKKPLQPRKVLHDIKINLRYENWKDIASFRDGFGNPLPNKQSEEETFAWKVPLVSKEKVKPEEVDVKGGYKILGQVHLDEIWACTTCAACVEVCPVLIDSVPTSLIEMRRNLVLMQAKDYPKELNAAFRGMEVQSNPWGVSSDKREDWASGLNVPILRNMPEKEVEYLFWVGCAGATDERAKKIQQALVRVLKKANVDFAILGCEEKCTGDPARRMGNEYIYDALAKENIEIVKKYKFKKIFVTCPHCLNQWKNEYKDYGVSYSVQHHTELLSELMKDGRLSVDLKKEVKDTITFHDPCYLGRYNQQYDAPRDVLSSLSNVPLQEMAFSKQKSFCCGAGGGRMFMEEPIGKRVNLERTDQALKTGAKTIATGCPFCMTMLSDGIKDRNPAEAVQVRDIAEILADHI